MIYTSYFAKISKLPDTVVPVSICAKPPAGYKGLQYKTLAPSYDILMEWKRLGNNRRYTERYIKEVLNKLTADAVVQELTALVRDPDKSICLVCYEKPTDFCHRHLVAKWLTENGYPCKEVNSSGIETAKL